MGQYWAIVNLDKKERIHPADFGDSRKFLEWGLSSGGLLTALAVLLAAPESMGDGGGDADRTVWTGRWAGDRIAIVGDYTKTGPHAGLYKDPSYTDLEFTLAAAGVT